MPSYTAPVRDIQFLLQDVMQVSTSDVPGYEALDAGFTQAVLEEAAKIAEGVLAPLNAVGDRQGCRLENGVVRTPDGFRAAFDQMREAGWPAMDCEPEWGGQGLPYLMHSVTGEMFATANMAFNMFQGLTHGAYSAIAVHGTDAQKAMYLPNLASCRWTGTMNLTEPHCGTDLGLMRTKAVPAADGSWQITGQKIFISAGEHDLAENIIHLVLAKAPGGGEGTKGISLFVVPKFLVNPDGSLGNRNALGVGKIEEKMGIHGSPTCVMNYDGATGWLVGELHKGMRAMFTMMNEARIGVGVQGYAQAEAAYQAALAYAKDRLQGRAVTGPANPDGSADPLIVHPDIRRALMDQKGFVEGARALSYWGSMLIDRAHHGDKDAEGLVSLLTPVIKGFQTDMGFQSAVQAQQVFGGHGYIEEWGVSQFVRDARIAMIYEGANGVQALDLIARKLPADGGRHMMAFFEIVKSECKAADPRLAAVADALKGASKQLQQAAMYFAANMKTPNAALAGSTDFLHMMGHVCLGLMWLRMAGAAYRLRDAGQGDADFLQAKIATARYYAARQMPACTMHLARIESGEEPVMALAPADF